MQTNKLTPNNNTTNKSLISEILNKKFINKSISMPITTNSFILQNILSPKNIKEHKNNLLFKSHSSNNKMYKYIDVDNKIKSFSSIQSMSTEISDETMYSPKMDINDSANLFIENTIDGQDDDSELITDTNLKINLKNNINNTENNIDKMSNIYNSDGIDLLILANLCFLSKIKPNQKIFVKYNKNIKINFEFKIDNSYLQNLSRWYYGQGRNETVENLKKLINLSTEQLNIYKQNNNIANMTNYTNSLKESINGIENLKITYETDKIIVEELELIIQKINENL